MERLPRRRGVSAGARWGARRASPEGREDDLQHERPDRRPGESLKNGRMRCLPRAADKKSLGFRRPDIFGGPGSRLVLRSSFSMHPAALAPVELLKACGLFRTKRSGPGGQHRNKTETAVIIVHQPTGISAEGAERRSQAENRRMAIRRLRVKLAVEHRTPADPSGPSELWRSRVQRRKLVISAGHEDFPPLLAEALDHLREARWQVSPAAEHLGISSTQLAGLIKKAPAAWTAVNKQRAAVGLPALK